MFDLRHSLVFTSVNEAERGRRNEEEEMERKTERGRQLEKGRLKEEATEREFER